MTIKLESNGYGEMILIIPQEVLDQLGWYMGDEIVIDIPTTHDSLLLHKKDTAAGWLKVVKACE